MTPRAYEACKALASDPRTPVHERENARRRVAEYEKKHPVATPRVARSVTLTADEFEALFNDAPPRTPSHAMCTCGHTFLRHPTIPLIVSCWEWGCPCRGFTPAPSRPGAKPGPKVPWWQLKIVVNSYPRTEKPLGLTIEFRQVLRSARALGSVSHCYRAFDKATHEALKQGRVDWTWFPAEERAGRKPWRPPPEMRAAMREWKAAQR